MSARIPTEIIFLREDEAPTLQGRLAAAIVRAVLESRARAGTRLPSSRSLAAALGISRMTVTLVYQELVSQGYLETLPRSGIAVAATVPHRRLRTSGVRLGVGRPPDWGVWLSDHQMPLDGSMGLSDGARDLCEGADVLIHDAQYTPAEFATKSDWGHCTIEYAVWVALEAGVKTLVLFHHDPGRHDDELDQILERVRCEAAQSGLEVLAAHEGLSLHP